MVGEAEGTIQRRLQYFRSHPHQQGHRQHTLVAGSVIPDQLAQYIRACSVSARRRKPPRLLSHYPLPFFQWYVLSHIISFYRGNSLGLVGDDEYDIYKAKAGNAMRERLGIAKNPLDGARARVRSRNFCCSAFSDMPPPDVQVAIYVPVLPQGRIHPIPDTGRKDCM
jgi:hypothetical protein